MQQDNISTQRLEINGTALSKKKTKHMQVRYFFIQDRIKNGDINIDHCGTDKMVADYSTKPLQGKKFEYFRAMIMGFDMDSIDGKPVTWEKLLESASVSPRSVLQIVSLVSSLNAASSVRTCTDTYVQKEQRLRKEVKSV